MILTFNDNFISELENKFSMNGKSQVLRNRRYYFTRLKILHENIYICLPLHSNAGFYYVKILIPSNKKERKVINHELNLEKLLLLTRVEIDKYGSQSFIQNEVYKDIKKKENHIKNSTEKYLNEYIRIVKKYDNGNILSKEYT